MTPPGRDDNVHTTDHLPASEGEKPPGETATEAYTPQEASTSGAAPPLVPGYAIEGVLGRGGMGVVYRARHLALKRPVALKVVWAGRHAGPGERSRFRIEAEAAARLQHPNIVQVFEVGEADGQPYCALEFVEGGNLAGKLRGQPLAAREAAELVKQLARAMHLAHSRNVVHRDLKPANVMLAADGTPKITDFGLARHLDGDSGETQAGAVMGTPSYMAPEQASGRAHEAGPAADVYALGAILYECLTGRPPFRGETIAETLEQVRTHEPVAPSRLLSGVPADLETVCLKCLRKEPEKRYASAAELADDLARYLRGEPVLARPVGLVERAVKWARRQPALAIMSVVLMLLVVGLVGGGVAFTLNLDEAWRAEGKARRTAESERRAAEAAAGRAEEGERNAREQKKRAEQERDLARRYLLTSQLLRVGQTLERDPMRALEVLEDARLCPPQAREAAWAFHWHACRRWRPTRLACDGGTSQCVAFSPDGKRLASGGLNGTVWLWDVARGKLLASLEGAKWPVAALAFSHDGKALAAGGGTDNERGEARLWDVAGRRPLGAPIARSRRVASVAFGKGSRTLVTAGFEGTVEARDLATGKDQVLRRGAKPGCYTAALAPDGGGLAAFDSGDHKVRLWRPPWAKERFTIDGGGYDVFSLALSADGKRLAGGLAAPGGNVRVWDAVSGKELASVEGFEGSASAVAPVATPDGYILCANSTGVQAVALSRDGALLASGTSDGLVRLWDLPSGQERITLRQPAGIRALDFSPDGKRLASANADGTISVWALEQDRVAPGRAPAQRLFGFGPDGRALAVAPAGKPGVELWDVVSGRSRTLVKGFTAAAGAFSPDGEAFAVAGPGDQALVVRLADGVERRRLPGVAPLKDGLPEKMALGPAGRTLAWVARHSGPGPGTAEARLRDLASGREQVVCRNQAEGVAFSRDGRCLAIGVNGNDAAGEVVLWDVAAGKQRRVLPGGYPRLMALAFSPDGKALAASFTDLLTGGRSARVWGVADGRLIAALDGHKMHVLCFGFSPDGKTLATGSMDRTVKLWDIGTGQERATIKCAASKASFSADGRTLALVGWDGTVRLWDVWVAGQR